MAVRLPKFQNDHDEMIRTLVRDLEDKGFKNIRASHIDEYEGRRPEKITLLGSRQGYVPDIFATRDGLGYIFEVETPDSIGGPNAEEEFKVLAASAEAEGSYVYLVVPQECKAAAEFLIRKLGFTRRPETFILTLPL
jgi:Holliday junction resolvase